MNIHIIHTSVTNRLNKQMYSQQIIPTVINTFPKGSPCLGSLWNNDRCI
mgnify:CR=1 FL=1